MTEADFSAALPGIVRTVLGGVPFWLVTGEAVFHWCKPQPPGVPGKYGVLVNDRRWYSMVNGQRIVPTKWNPKR